MPNLLHVWRFGGISISESGPRSLSATRSRQFCSALCSAAGNVLVRAFSSPHRCDLVVASLDGGTCYTSAFQDEKPRHDQCPCPRSEGPVAILSTSEQEVALTSLAMAQPTGLDPSRLNVDAPVAKRGFAYNNATLVNRFMDNMQCTECSWAYNWDSTDNGILPHSLNFVPMLWSPAANHTGRWPQNADAMISSRSTHILSFNECDRPDQCNLDAASAAAAHVKFVNRNSAAAGEGLSWLELWVWTCDSLGCEYDFCVAHWYGNSVEDLLKHVASVHEICRGKPVWLTEFAINDGSDEQHAAFITAVIPKLDAVDYLERYAYFMIREGRFVSGSTITSSGQAYAEV
ncbi:glycosyl hydrolase catalytic core-domain-containing protein [Colletotrichum cereale]|nr:glycosyl hydrolase catalytic core-domain-containing protein [Colletotrichum cereale]